MLFRSHNSLGEDIAKYTGTGQAKFSADDVFLVEHTSGNVIIPSDELLPGYYYQNTIIGRESNNSVTFSSTQIIVTNLLDEEKVYYSPVSYYDFENEKNEKNKSIRVLDQPYAKKVANIVRDLLE